MFPSLFGTSHNGIASHASRTFEVQIVIQAIPGKIHDCLMEKMMGKIHYFDWAMASNMFKFANCSLPEGKP
jgi:hypothetical protein